MLYQLQQISLEAAIGVNKLDQTLIRLRKEQNYYVDLGVWCCGTCASSDAINQADGQPFVYYHEQDEARAHDSNQMHLGYGCSSDQLDEYKKVGNIIAQYLKEDGFIVEWDGDPDNRIGVTVNGHKEPEDHRVLEIDVKVPTKVVPEYENTDLWFDEENDEYSSVLISMADNSTFVEAIQESDLKLEHVIEYRLMISTEEELEEVTCWTQFNPEELEEEEVDPGEVLRQAVQHQLESFKGKTSIGSQEQNVQISNYWDKIKDIKHKENDSTYRQVAMILAQYYRGEIEYQPMKSLLLKGFDHKKLFEVFMDIQGNHASMI